MAVQFIAFLEPREPGLTRRGRFSTPGEEGHNPSERRRELVGASARVQTSRRCRPGPSTSLGLLGFKSQACELELGFDALHPRMREV